MLFENRNVILFGVICIKVIFKWLSEVVSCLFLTSTIHKKLFRILFKKKAILQKNFLAALIFRYSNCKYKIGSCSTFLGPNSFFWADNFEKILFLKDRSDSPVTKTPFFSGFKDYIAIEDTLAQTGTWLVFITVLFYSIFLSTALMVCNVYLLYIVQVTCDQLQAMFVIIRMKMRSSSGSNNNNNTTSTMEVKTLLSVLLYTIVPTIWCLGSQGLRFFF